MTVKKRILGLVDPRREVRRPPLVGMEFLHQGAVSPADILRARPRLQAKDLIGLLFRHFAGRRSPDLSALPPCPIALRVLTPAGKPAVQITFKQRAAFRIERLSQTN